MAVRSSTPSAVARYCTQVRGVDSELAIQARFDKLAVVRADTRKQEEPDIPSDIRLH